MARTLYDVLGVASDVSSDELRRAYRDLARALHPDRQGSTGPGAELRSRRMQEVNAAWRVLRDPQARSAYDRSLHPAPPVARAAPEDDLDRPFRGRPAEPGDPVVAIVRALPWLVIGIILGAIFVFTAFAGKDEASPGQDVGDCVRVSPAVEVVPCTGPEDEVIVAVERTAAECPRLSRSQRAGGEVLCLQPFTGSSP